jgi:hypothetical protein
VLPRTYPPYSTYEIDVDASNHRRDNVREGRDMRDNPTVYAVHGRLDYSKYGSHQLVGR